MIIHDMSFMPANLSPLLPCIHTLPDLPDFSSHGLPTLYRFSLHVSSPADSFLDMRGWTKGVAWVNGFNLGRYWPVSGRMRMKLLNPESHISPGRLFGVLQTAPLTPHTAMGMQHSVAHTIPHSSLHSWQILQAMSCRIECILRRLKNHPNPAVPTFPLLPPIMCQERGPYCTLYIPAPLLQPGSNTIVSLELLACSGLTTGVCA